MEKYIKNLSITLMILTGLFFLSVFGGINGDALHMPQFIINTLMAGTYALIFIVPLLYLAIFGIGMVSIFTKAVNLQAKTIGQKLGKFPTVWFLLSFLCFMIYIIFLNWFFM